MGLLLKKLINAQVVSAGENLNWRKRRNMIMMVVMKLEMVLYLNNVMECCFFVLFPMVLPHPLMNIDFSFFFFR